MMLAVVLTGDVNAIGFDSVIVGPGNDSESDVFIATQNEGIKGTDSNWQS